MLWIIWGPNWMIVSHQVWIIVELNINIVLFQPIYEYFMHIFIQFAGLWEIFAWINSLFEFFLTVPSSVFTRRFMLYKSVNRNIKCQLKIKWWQKIILRKNNLIQYEWNIFFWHTIWDINETFLSYYKILFPYLYSSEIDRENLLLNVQFNSISLTPLYAYNT